MYGVFEYTSAHTEAQPPRRSRDIPATRLKIVSRAMNGGTFASKV